jgi:ribonuclease HII
MRGDRRELAAFDDAALRRGGLLAGADEAGRGPIAGPVVGCAVILGPDACLPGLDDSKRLSQAQREGLFDAIMSQSVAVSVVSVGEKIIDSVNILRASLLAMSSAVDALSAEPDLLLVDGPYRLPVRMGQRAVVGGDGLSRSIAAASVVAKVVRDDLMLGLDRVYPRYSFQANKGYPTRKHLDALARHGPCPVHRYSFGPVRARAQGSLID